MPANGGGGGTYVDALLVMLVSGVQCLLDRGSDNARRAAARILEDAATQMNRPAFLPPDPSGQAGRCPERDRDLHPQLCEWLHVTPDEWTGQSERRRSMSIQKVLDTVAEFAPKGAAAPPERAKGKVFAAVFILCLESRWWQPEICEEIALVLESQASKLWEGARR